MNIAFRVSVFLGGMVMGSFYHELTNDDRLAPTNQFVFQEATALQNDPEEQKRYYSRDTLTRQDKRYISSFEE